MKKIWLIAVLTFLALPAQADNYRAFNNGLSVQNVPDDYQAQSGDVLFDHNPTSADLGAAFEGYAAAAATQSTTLGAQATYQTALKAGFTVSCGSGATVCTSGIAGTYALDLQSQNNIEAEIINIDTNGTFTNGQTTHTWPDASGALHTFTIAQFKALATAIGAFIDALDTALETVQGGGAWSAPSNSATIP